MTIDRRLRVLHVGKFYPPHRGGMETHLQALCDGMRDSVDLKVIVANSGRRTEREVVDGVEVLRVGTSFELASAQFCPTMAASIRRAEADIIHIHLPNPTAILAYLASKHAGRLVLSYHSDIVRQKILGRAFEPILRRALERSSAVIAASPNYIESSPSLVPFRDRCHVIPYGIPLEPFDRVDPAAVARIREEFGPRIILGVGRLVYYKGFEYLIEAMRSVDGRLLLIGDGPLRSALEQRATRLGIPDRVIFLGGVPDLVPYYAAADLFVLPSIARSEAFGIVQIEAMASRRPVVNTRLDSGVPFVSLHGVTGFTVPPRDPSSLAEAINRLLEDGDTRARLGAAARGRAEAEFNQDLMVERTLDLYGQVMSEAPGAGKGAARAAGDPSVASSLRMTGEGSRGVSVGHSKPF